MGLMDSVDIQDIWQAIQESEQSDEDLWPHTNEASGREKAVTERPTRFSGPCNRPMMSRRKTPHGTRIRVPRPMHLTPSVREPQIVIPRNTTELHSQFPR
jgi:hypothetical protein